MQVLSVIKGLDNAFIINALNVCSLLCSFVTDERKMNKEDRMIVKREVTNQMTRFKVNAAGMMW